MLGDPDPAICQHQPASLDRLCPSLLSLGPQFYAGLLRLELSLDALFQSVLHRAFRGEL